MPTEAARQFLARRPAHIGQVAGSNFYEDPDFGDEAPLVEITSSGVVRDSDYWDLPTAEELMDQ